MFDSSRRVDMFTADVEASNEHTTVCDDTHDHVKAHEKMNQNPPNNPFSLISFQMFPIPQLAPPPQPSQTFANTLAFIPPLIAIGYLPGYRPILVQRRSKHLLTRYSPRIRPPGPWMQWSIFFVSTNLYLQHFQPNSCTLFDLPIMHHLSKHGRPVNWSYPFLVSHSSMMCNVHSDVFSLQELFI